MSGNSFTSRSITREAAARLIADTVAAAERIGFEPVVAIVDVAGNLKAFERSDRSSYLAVNIAIDKAYTAASFGLPTDQWHDALQNHSAAVREGIVRRLRFVGFGGGLPIVLDGQRIGGIGVSGASEAQDGMIAQAGLDAIVALAVGA